MYSIEATSNMAIQFTDQDHLATTQGMPIWHQVPFKILNKKQYYINMGF